MAKLPVRPLDVPDRKWAEALKRAAVIQPLASQDRTNRTEIDRTAQELGLKRSQVYRLIRAFRERPVTQSLVPNNRGPSEGSRRLSTAVEEIIEKAIDTVYKRREKPTISHLLREIRQICNTAGQKSPSRKAVSARLRARPPRELVRARQGSKEARNRFALVRSGLKPSAPLHIVQVDHTLVDLQLVDEEFRIFGRPWLTLLLDVYTRCVLGFTISFDNPSAAVVALAVAHAVLPKKEWLSRRQIDLAWPMHGIPKTLHLDNAKEFGSRALKRGCQQYGIAIDHRKPGMPWLGGHIERLIGTLMTRIHDLPGSTSSNVLSKGDYDSEEQAVLTLDDFERIFALEVLGPYHNDVHSELGKTPAAAWAESIAATGEPQLPPDAKEFVFDFLPFEERKVRREGVRIKNVMYFDGALQSLVGTPYCKRRVRFDPRDMSRVFVEMPDRSHLTVHYADLGKPPVTLWEIKLASQALRAAGRRTKNEDAIFYAIEERRRVLLEAAKRKRSARRQLARIPGNRSRQAISSMQSELANPPSGQIDTRVTLLRATEGEDDWTTEFLS